MQSKTGQVLRYIQYLLKAGNAHHIHSPFVFDLYTNLIQSKKSFYSFNEIEIIRSELFHSQQAIEVTDYGAGSKVDNHKERSIRSIAKYAASSRKEAQLLFKLVDRFQPEVMLELGTSLGITTCYQAKANPDGEMYTFEGSKEIARVARINFEKLGITNVKVIEGNIDHTLPQQVDRLKKIDYAFFDANHRFAPTMKYFETCLTKADEDTLFVFDDIYWSQEMAKAWKAIKQRPEVKLTIDLYSLGLVFFRNKQPKQHFVLRF